jgi:hypothetical protein
LENLHIKLLGFPTALLFTFPSLNQHNIMNPIRVGLMQPGKQQQDDCDGWRDKLVGKTIVGDEAVTSLPAGSVRTNNILYTILDPYIFLCVILSLSVRRIYPNSIESLDPTLWRLWTIDLID